MKFTELSTMNGYVGNSSSSSSQDRPIGPLPAKCWPEAFHATFIHNIRESVKAKIRLPRVLLCGCLVCYSAAACVLLCGCMCVIVRLPVCYSAAGCVL